MHFRAGELLETVLQAEFRHVLEGAGIAKPLTESASGHQLTIGDPEGEWGRQSLTGPRWGGLLVAKVASPLAILRVPLGPARTVRVAGSQLSLFDLS